ncbi:MAG: hypothetical protein ACRECY_09915 [Phyllobacterium sp.]
MRIEISHHVDASEPDADGWYLYHYEYDIYVFSEGATSFFVRAYSDDPGRASFQSRLQDDVGHALTSKDLRHPLFIAAADHLREIGKPDLTWLSRREGAYLPVSEGPAASEGLLSRRFGRFFRPRS